MRQFFPPANLPFPAGISTIDEHCCESCCESFRFAREHNGFGTTLSRAALPQERSTMNEHDDENPLHCKTYDVNLIAPHMQTLHEYVTRTLGRVEITRTGSEERCVLI